MDNANPTPKHHINAVVAILLVVVAAMAVAGVWWWQTQTAKMSALEQKVAQQTTPTPTATTRVTPTPTPISTPTPTATPYTGKSYIELTEPKADYQTHEEPIIFKGKVSPNTQKIVATAKADGVNDVYPLENYTAGSTSFQYQAKIEYKNLNYGSNDFTFTAHFSDGSTQSASVKIFFVNGTAEIGKPVIYLYPEKTSKVFVNVAPINGISVSEPALNRGWNVIATPESKIYDLASKKYYDYLFWEGFASNFKTPAEGFVVDKDGVNSFFDEKLATLGLNAKETADFKEFWVPRLSSDPYYFITFVPQAEFDRYAPLTVKPTPDSVIRVFFDYRGLADKIDVPEQQLTTPAREGFTVVEWGGRLYR